MTTTFVGGAISSAVTGALHTAGGWTGVCAVGTALPLAGPLMWSYGQWTTARTQAQSDACARPRPRTPWTSHERSRSAGPTASSQRATGGDQVAACRPGSRAPCCVAGVDVAAFVSERRRVPPLVPHYVRSMMRQTRWQRGSGTGPAGRGLAPLVAGLVGLAVIVVGLVLAAGSRVEQREFERAPYCSTPPPADTSHCKLRVSMTVTARSTYTTSDRDPPDPPNPPDPVPPPPPALPQFRVGSYVRALRVGVVAGAMARSDVRVVHAPVLAGLRMAAASETTHYEITVRTADGRHHKLEVEQDFYKVAKPGTVGTAESWHGRLLRLRIGSHVDYQYPFRWVIPYLIIIVGAGVLVYPMYRLIRSVYDAIRWRYRPVRRLCR